MDVKRKTSTNLTAKWQLDAALLSRPVDLTALVSMSRTTPDKFTEDDTLHRLIAILLNEKNKIKSDKDTKLDVLNILANVAGGCKKSVAEVRVALGGISEWFDEYIATEESDPGEEPELHKAMVLLLARCWDYRLKTEDVLELTQGNRRIALCTVVGILEDGETYSTELKRRQSPGAGKMGQWEHELVCQRYEKPLLLQTCRLLRGFTHPGTYFEASTEELALYNVEKFAEEIDGLLDITLRSKLVEKLAMALYDCLFDSVDEKEKMKRNLISLDNVEETSLSSAHDVVILEESDHMAVVSVHAFLQNLYFYTSGRNDEFRSHMLVETLLIPRLVLPYLDRCVTHATILNQRAEAYSDMLEGDVIAEMALHNPQLVKGIAASLRTLIVASFRAPATQFVMALLKRLNPTAQILRARSFCKHHEYIFALLCLLNVNMGALDLSRSKETNATGDSYTRYEGYHAPTLLSELATVFSSMDSATQARVHKRVVSSGALPISRDTPSYVAVISILNGGEAGQLEYGLKKGAEEKGGNSEDDNWDSRAEAKSDIKTRMASMKDDSSSNMTSSIQNENNRHENQSENENFSEEKNEINKSDMDEKGQSSSYRLLGDLPSLGAGPSNNRDYNREKARERDQVDKEIKVALNLELPQAGFKGPFPGGKKGVLTSSDKSSSNSKNVKSQVDSDIPQVIIYT